MTILSEAFLNWEPVEYVKHVKPSNSRLRDVLCKFGDNKKSIIQREKEEYTPLPIQQQAMALCVCMQI